MPNNLQETNITTSIENVKKSGLGGPNNSELIVKTGQDGNYCEITGNGASYMERLLSSTVNNHEDWRFNPEKNTHRLDIRGMPSTEVFAHKENLRFAGFSSAKTSIRSHYIEVSGRDAGVLEEIHAATRAREEMALEAKPALEKLSGVITDRDKFAELAKAGEWTAVKNSIHDHAVRFDLDQLPGASADEYNRNSHNLIKKTQESGLGGFMNMGIEVVRTLTETKGENYCEISGDGALHMKKLLSSTVDNHKNWTFDPENSTHRLDISKMSPPERVTHEDNLRRAGFTNVTMDVEKGYIEISGRDAGVLEEIHAATRAREEMALKAKLKNEAHEQTEPEPAAEVEPVEEEASAAEVEPEEEEPEPAVEEPATMVSQEAMDSALADLAKNSKSFNNYDAKVEQVQAMLKLVHQNSLNDDIDPGKIDGLKGENTNKAMLAYCSKVPELATITSDPNQRDFDRIHTHLMKGLEDFQLNRAVIALETPDAGSEHIKAALVVSKMALGDSTLDTQITPEVLISQIEVSKIKTYADELETSKDIESEATTLSEKFTNSAGELYNPSSPDFDYTHDTTPKLIA